MLSVFLTRTNDERGAWLRLPSSPASMGEAYVQLDQFADADSPALITQVKGANGFQDYLMGYTTDDPEQRGKLDAFAQRLGEYSMMQWDLLLGAVTAENSETIEDVLRVMDHLNQYEAIPNIYDAMELGYYLVEEGIIHIDSSVRQYVDYTLVGAQYQKTHPGAYTDGFYICKRDDAAQPCQAAARQPVFDLRLYTSHIGDTRPGPYRLTLPATNVQLERAMMSAEVSHFDECMIENWECQIPSLAGLLPEGVDDVEAMNELATEIAALQERDGLRKLLAVLEIERPDTFALARDIVLDLDDYELCKRDISCASDYGEHVLYNSGRDGQDFELKDEVRDFIDFEAYGKYKMEEDGVRSTEQGLLRRLNEPFSPEQGQGQMPCM